MWTLIEMDKISIWSACHGVKNGFFVKVIKFIDQLNQAWSDVVIKLV